MAKSAAPLLLLAGAGALLMSGKKKKKSSSKSSDTPYGDLPSEDDFPSYEYPDPADKPAMPSRPPGNPPRGETYDEGYWGSTSDERLENIRTHFKFLGYPVEIGPWPMNKLGPKGNVELTNKDGSKGKLGGDDDMPNETVRDFQKDWNKVSRLNKADKVISPDQSMGGLKPDGLVGPYTLNGLRFAVEQIKANQSQGKTWEDLVHMASIKGIT